MQAFPSQYSIINLEVISNIDLFIKEIVPIFPSTLH